MSEQSIEIRPETLCPFERWEPPTKEEIREMIRLAAERMDEAGRLPPRGLTGSEVAKLVGVSQTGTGAGKGSRTVRRWVAGETPIAYGAWCILAEEAGYGLIWKK